MQVTGTIREISTKDWQDRDGQTIQLHSFQIDGDRRWFRTGTNPVPFGPGTRVTFDLNPKGNKAMAIAQAASEVANTAPPRSTYTPKPNARDAYFEEKQRRDIEVVEPRINFSASQRDAISLVTSALANDCLALGTKKGDRLEILLEMVDEVALRFYHQRKDTKWIEEDTRND